MPKELLLGFLGLIGVILVVSYVVPSSRLNCRTKGGQFISTGTGGVCVTPYSDGGKFCEDSDDCEGRCVFAQTDDPKYQDFAKKYRRGDELEVDGTCETNNAPLKCSVEVKKGFVDSLISCEG